MKCIIVMQIPSLRAKVMQNRSAVNFSAMAGAILGLLVGSGLGAADFSVTDGDGLRIGDEHIRLWGIDAPELRQTCERLDVPYGCGAAARDMLEALTADGQVKCEKVDQDHYGRTVARCFVGGLDLGAELVRQGWAVDFERYSKGAYARQQREARDAGRGLWSGEFVMPWDWRRNH